MNLPHIMFDLETLSVADDACIVQIGAVRFDPFAEERGLISTPEGEFRQQIELVSPPPGTHRGYKRETIGVIDASTVLWWMRQSDDARRRVFEDENRKPLSIVLYQFRAWVYDQGQPEHVWSDANFDWTLLRQAYTRLGIVFPFAYRQCRDYRTLRMLGKMLGVEEPEFVGVQHDALDDAHHQAIHASNILRALKR